QRCAPETACTRREIHNRMIFLGRPWTPIGAGSNDVGVGQYLPQMLIALRGLLSPRRQPLVRQLLAPVLVFPYSPKHSCPIQLLFPERHDRQLLFAFTVSPQLSAPRIPSP